MTSICPEIGALPTLQSSDSDRPPQETLRELKKKLRLLMQAGIIVHVEGSEPTATFAQRADGKFSCSLCKEQSYSNIKSVKHHLRALHWLRDKCDICGETFTFYDRLKPKVGAVTHILSKHGADERVIEALQDSPKTRRFPTIHPLFYTGILQKRATKRTNAKVISKTERGAEGELKKGFGCSECTKIFNKQESGARRHIQRFHEGFQEICNICKATLPFNRGIRHVTKKHPTDSRVVEALDRPRKRVRRMTLTSNKSLLPHSSGSLKRQDPELSSVMEWLQNKGDGWACSCNLEFIHSSLSGAQKHVLHSHRPFKHEVRQDKT